MINIFNLVIMTKKEYNEKLHICQIDTIYALRNKNGDKNGNNKYSRKIKNIF